jgi:hypothetical protein
VTIIDEFIGNQLRRAPLMLAVNPSRQRSTYGARTVPSPGGAEAGEFPLQHKDAQGRLSMLEVVGRPQAGQAGSNDAHVGIGITRQRGCGVLVLAYQ